MTGRLTLDTGILVALDRGDRHTWNLLRRFLVREGVPVVPTVVVAEAWRGGRQARLAQALAHCRIAPLDDRLARRAGELNARAGLDDPVDAVVVVTASSEGGVLWTHDPDLEVLAAHLPAGALSVRVERVV